MIYCLQYNLQISSLTLIEIVLAPPALQQKELLFPRVDLITLTSSEYGIIVSKFGPLVSRGRNLARKTSMLLYNDEEGVQAACGHTCRQSRLRKRSLKIIFLKGRGCQIVQYS